MKTLALIIVALLCGGCTEQLTTSVMTGSDTDLTVRAGIIQENTEIGAVVKYGVSSEVEWGPEPDAYGGYVIFHLTQEVTIEDTPEYSLIQPWLERLNARPYAGLELVGSCDDTISDVQTNWILGTSFTMSEDADISLNIEYIDGDQAAGDVYIGMGYKF